MKGHLQLNIGALVSLFFSHVYNEQKLVVEVTSIAGFLLFLAPKQVPRSQIDAGKFVKMEYHHRMMLLLAHSCPVEAVLDSYGYQ